VASEIRHGRKGILYAVTFGRYHAEQFIEPGQQMIH